MLHVIVICPSNYKLPSVMLLSYRVLSTALHGRCYYRPDTYTPM